MGYHFLVTALVGILGFIWCGFKILTEQPELPGRKRFRAVLAGLLFGTVGLAVYCGFLFIIMMSSVCFIDCQPTVIDRLPDVLVIILIILIFCGFPISSFLSGLAGSRLFIKHFPSIIVQRAALMSGLVFMVWYLLWNVSNG